MKIDFDYEISNMNPDLQLPEGYLEYEKAILYNVRKHISKGHDDMAVTNSLEKRSAYFSDSIEISQNKNCCPNYGYVQRSINRWIKMPYWRSWTKTIAK